jgi:hypothetical protein
MQTRLTKQSGAEFVAVRTPGEGGYFLECFHRAPPPAPGFPSEMQTIHNNTSLPVGLPREKTDALAVSLAGQWGFAAADIAWED